MKIEEMVITNRADCSGCEACANICPKNAIIMTRDAEGFAYPKINPELCIRCGRCDATCPALNYEKIFPTISPRLSWRLTTTIKFCVTAHRAACSRR